MFLFKRRRPEERRQYPRINDASEVKYQLSNEPMRPECRAKDISEAGVRFGLYPRLEPGTTLRLGLFLRDLVGPTLILGRVAWIRETSGQGGLYEAGVAFEGLSDSLRAKIQGHIQALSASRQEVS
jgi:hypothetical protein